MCGIAGIIGRLGDSNRAALGRMSAAMVHRGPDAEGAWRSPPDARGRGVMLAHRRLSILDLAPTGAQPMVDEATGNVVVFNGEIYNYVELRDRLVAAGNRFRSSGDTAVMLRALSVEGFRALPSLRGMFALAFWNAAERTLALARDPLGIKPLYVASNRDPEGDWSVVFASEVRAILASGLLGTPRLDPAAVASVAWNGFVAGPTTAVIGVELLSPGQVHVFDAAGKERLREDFWTIPSRPPGAATCEADLEHVLEECVRVHLASDVPLGVFLSGGVDSSAVANLARRASRAPVHTFTLAFEEPEYNEGHVARRVAEAIGTQHREVVLTEGRFVAQLDAALDSLDQPTFDGLNAYYMSQAVREAGFKVALVGTGGDELFGGYTSFRDLPTLLQWSRRMDWVPLRWRVGLASWAAAALRGARGSRGPVPPQTRWAKLPDMVRRGRDLVALYQFAYALFLPDFQRELLLDGSAGQLVDGLPPSVHARLTLETRSRSPLSAISVMEQRLFLGERLLRDNDAASMAASIEQRLPLVDQVLFEAVDRLPDQLRYHPLRRKALLRRIGLRGLDPALFERPKSGFVLPYDRWIRLGLGKAMDGIMRDPEAVRPTGLDPDAVARLWRAFVDGSSGIYWSRVWAVFVFLRWCHRHRVYL
jgi:asparagine synthase (glutamine-hydrolysing)